VRSSFLEGFFYYSYLGESRNATFIKDYMGEFISLVAFDALIEA
jgi:hypothetical protein